MHRGDMHCFSTHIRTTMTCTHRSFATPLACEPPSVEEQAAVVSEMVAYANSVRSSTAAPATTTATPAAPSADVIRACVNELTRGVRILRVSSSRGLSIGDYGSRAQDHSTVVSESQTAGIL